MKINKKQYGYALLTALTLIIWVDSFGQSYKPVKPLLQGHSHNDYWRAAPLYDALRLGFKSVEADIFLKDGELLVGHSLKELKPDVTLESLYLRPLQQIIKQHKKVYSAPEELLLYIDFKTDGPATYNQLKPLLQQYKNILVQPGKPKAKGFVKIILTGSYPQEMVLTDKRRYVFLDGKVNELTQNSDAAHFPVVNGNWNHYFKWRGKGEIPAEEAAQLKAWNNLARKNNQRIRFWSMPEKDEASLRNIWQELLKYESILIGTDHLDWLKDTLDQHQKK